VIPRNGERLWAWIGPLAATVVAGVLRFVRLGTPHKIIFDETYSAKQGASYLGHGVEMSLSASLSADPKLRNDVADRLFTAGNLDLFGTDPDRAVHPMVGKWMIAFGEWLFGPGSSVGWRFSAAACGTLSVLLLGRIAYRLFGSALLATTAALLLAVDGAHFVQSRTSLLDIFVMFWALVAFGCLLLDRDQARARLDRLRATRPPGALGPWPGVRWWRVAAVVALGLCTGVKWSGLYVAAAFLTLSVVWDVGARRAAGIRRPVLGGLLKDGVPAAVTTLVLLPAVYLATWASWFASTDGWNRTWAAANPAGPGAGWVPDALRSLWHYHVESWQFHVGLTSPHPWQASPWAWLVQGRPTLFFFDTHHDGHAGCHAATCQQMITDLGNPVVWWAGTLAVGVLVFRWVLARDWRAGAVLVGLIGGYLPWFAYQQRTIFEFYAVEFVPWVVLAVTYVIGLVLGPRDAPARRRRIGGTVAGGYVLLAVLAFAYFYPILAGRTIPQSGIDARDWLPSWY